MFSNRFGWPRHASVLFFSLRYASIFSLFLVSPLHALEQQKTSLELRPQRCIALHRGQQCYQKVNLRWKSERSGNFCLFVKGVESQLKLSQSKPLMCWQNRSEAEFSYEFSAAQSSHFLLVEMQAKQEVGRAKLDLVWVYKRSKKISSGWRLF